MIKSARCGLVTYRISGGYFASPMWSSSSKVRRGPVHGEVVNVYTAEQLSAMTAAEVQEIVDLIFYVTSEKGAFMTGNTIYIDGGRNAWQRG